MSTPVSKGIVLVVDDSTDTLGLLNEALMKEDYTVLVAMDGVQALSIAARLMPDIILMDAMMPNMDGFEACIKLKDNSELNDIPVIFMTGLSESEHVVKGLEVGGVDYINKPINLDELMARLKVHLKNARITRSARGALNEIGPMAVACDIHGQLLWATDSASLLLAELSQLENHSDDHMADLIGQWLARKPEKHSSLRIDVGRSLQLRYLGQPSPAEFLFRILDDDELRARNALRDGFGLTDRESEVVYWLSLGKTNREIGQILSMSPRTVNKHLESIFPKLAVDNRTAATSRCLQFLNQR
jgi:DNA-binding response OmpR family regulator/DNA-binding CsgD family transcriptional regulator